MADGTDDRRGCLGYRPNESFVAEGQKILDAPATAGDHDDVDVCARIEFLKSLSYLPHRVYPLHGDFANLEVGGGPAIPRVDHDIVLGVAVAAADQTDTTREERKWLLAFWGEQSLGGQGCLELGEAGEEFSDTDGADGSGAQLQTAATSPEFGPSPDHDARSGLQWWVEPADELGIGDDRERGVGFNVSQGQELHARLRAGTEVGHLAFDPDGAQLSYPVAEHLRHRANGNRGIWARLQRHGMRVGGGRRGVRERRLSCDRAVITTGTYDGGMTTTDGQRKILLAAPRGYCAGVDRAVVTVEKALDLYGAPVYVRKQIVHNKHVVETLEKRGAIFVDEVEEVPEGSTVVFSAHGVAPEVHTQAADRQLKTIDATCPLVTKVHSEAKRFAAEGYDIILIGHDGHEEVVGTMGEAPEAITLVEDPASAADLEVENPDKLVWLSQTTLSVDETMQTVNTLQGRFPNLMSPPSDDICYATQNRQVAVKEIARDSDVVIVVGSGNSSNSVRLVEVALEAGAGSSYRVDSAQEIDPTWFDGATTVGVTSGASVPDVLVNDVLDSLKDLGFGTVEEVTTAEETLVFALPPELRRDLKAASAEASANASS